ncbi:MAG: dihydrodipicolinate synthase family protein [Candidatus Eremiobacteraeota bacterium]|nr:dihydrodipicolinate synthase family protein [Candidatus Eremiobacteraeota bacterium]MBV8354402.1 dihydrodipicolinate synthase family protein [Candidatus Eremiobacteraeota bacterium]
MDEKRRPHGICAAILTPLDADDRPDAARFVARARTLLAEGCDALNVLGTTGEANSIALAERRRFIEAVAASGLPLERMMVGTGTPALHDTIELTRAVASAGFGGALILPPFYYKPLNDDDLLAYFGRVIEAVERIPIYLYNFPQMSGIAYPVSFVGRLVAAHPGRVAGIKDSSGDLAYCRRLKDEVPGLDIFPSSEAYLLEARRQGYAGCISATVNVTSAASRRVWSGPEDEDAQTALTAMRVAIASVPLIPAVRFLTATVTGDPAWERMLPPLRPLDAEQRTRLLERLEKTEFDVYPSSMFSKK